MELAAGADLHGRCGQRLPRVDAADAGIRCEPARCDSAPGMADSGRGVSGRCHGDSNKAGVAGRQMVRGPPITRLSAFGPPLEGAFAGYRTHKRSQSAVAVALGCLCSKDAESCFRKLGRGSDAVVGPRVGGGGGKARGTKIGPGVAARRRQCLTGDQSTSSDRVQNEFDRHHQSLTPVHQ